MQFWFVLGFPYSKHLNRVLESLRSRVGELSPCAPGHDSKASLGESDEDVEDMQPALHKDEQEKQLPECLNDDFHGSAYGPPGSYVLIKQGKKTQPARALRARIRLGFASLENRNLTLHRDIALVGSAIGDSHVDTSEVGNHRERAFLVGGGQLENSLAIGHLKDAAIDDPTRLILLKLIIGLTNNDPTQVEANEATAARLEDLEKRLIQNG